MSKVTIDPIQINEVICSCLDYLRKMKETGDYSALPAITERIQQHANAMEEGLYSAFKAKSRILVLCGDKEMDDKKFREEVDQAMLKYIKKGLEDWV